jgi:hypothetical protein
MSTAESRMCQEVEESLSEILDGTASARLFDHVAECDACRDLKYEAQQAAAHVAEAGADWRPAGDFVEALIGRLEAARPATSGPKATSRPRAALAETAPATSVVVRSGPIEPGAESAATVFDPLAAAKVAEAEAESQREAKREEPEASEEPEAREEKIGDTRPSGQSVKSASAPAGATREEAPSPIALVEARAEKTEPPVASSVSATTNNEPISKGAARDAGDARDSRDASDAGDIGETEVPEPAPSPRASKTIEAAPARPSHTAPDKPVVPKAPARQKPSTVRRPVMIAGGALAMAAAVAIGFAIKGGGVRSALKSSSGPWSGSVAAVSRASADKTGGLEACEGSRCAPVVNGAAIKEGSTLRTDTRTRAKITLGDGTALAIDRGSEIELTRGKSRWARVKRGTVVADVAHVAGSNAHFAFARGDVEVVGTKLAITAGDDRASVEVARGAVRVHTDSGKTVDVRAGEEATIVGNAEPQVSSSTSLADTMEWSDAKPEEVDAPVLRGLGELRARKPGQTKEKDHAVRLAKHAVKVRIVDVVARTEVDEVFTNDTDEELEGIYRFPLPPGAQIEKLSLEVDGKLIDGAFVDRDKGAAIWRGVIQNAAPKAPKPREEIIWVPGPWRDPALLEWQRGGRFELKIFPIPKRGSRRVVLTYTQTVDQAAGIRRFIYPLAHDPSGSTKIGSFDLDLQVLGLDQGVGLSTRGYDLASASGDGARRTMHANDFVPAGDLTVEYALPDRNKEVTAWAYAPQSVDSSIAANNEQANKKKSAEERAADQAAAAIVEDRSPYVAVALRPRLPRWQEAKERLHVLVVDASRSMFGERFARATHLASAIVREMDRRDSFLLLACDTTCKPMSPDGSTSPQPGVPGPSAAADVERFLGSIEPDGGSDLSAAVSAARTVAGALNGKELRIEYLGDGTPSVGPTRPAHIEAALRAVMPAGDAAVIAVALGADADTTSLGALARGGGGVMVPYVPGQKVSSAALDVLAAAYGVVLRDVEVELPAGLSQVTPAKIDPIRAGGETILVARMSSGGEVAGALKLRGKVAGERFEQSYPIRVRPTASAGNAFVPRLYAAAKIAEIERSGSDSDKPVAIALSKRFSVASRFTSLLVLESEAMFKAFGLDRSAAGPTFTGEQQADSSSADAESPVDDVASAESSGALAAATAAPVSKSKKADAFDGDGLGSMGGFGSGHGRAARGPMRPSPKPAAQAAPMAPPPADEPWAGADRKAPASRPAPAKTPARRGWDDPVFWEPPRRRRFVPMRRVFDRKVSFAATSAFASNAGKVAGAESALAASPNSRDRTVELFTFYSTLGRLGEAQELTAKWSGRDALDPDALLARADLAARQGDRDRAVRILGGLADVRPGDRAIQERLADMHDAGGNAALACEHRITLAEMAPTDAKIMAAASSCARVQGIAELATALRGDASEKVREAMDKIATSTTTIRTPRGDMTISAEWTGGEDVDIGLIDAKGRRTSWLGSATKATVNGRDVKSTSNEALEIRALPQGSYTVEITRVGNGTAPVRGEVKVRFGNEVTKHPFTLIGARTEAGTVRVFFTSRLVPL